jgi:hypothetical protein
MTAMTVALLKAKGFTPDRKAGMGSAAVRAALENGQVDVYWEYTGTGLGVFHKITDKFPSAQAAYQKIKELDAPKGIVWLNMSAVNNTYGFAMNKDDAQKRGIVTMSDFAKAVKSNPKITFASNAEFYARPDGLPGWQTAYGFEFDRENVKRNGYGTHLQRSQGPSSRFRRRLRHRRPHPRVQFCRVEGRQRLRSALQPHPRCAQGSSRQESQVGRCAEFGCRQAQRRDDGEAERERGRRQEDARRSGRGFPEGERADLILRR